MAGCFGRRVDEKEEIDRVLNQVMQAIVKKDVGYLEQVLVPNLESSIAWTGKDEKPYTQVHDTNTGLLDAWFNFDMWSYSAAQLTARDIEVTGKAATASGAYMDRYVVTAKPDCEWERTSPLRAQLQQTDGKWRVTKLEFLDLWQEKVTSP